MNIRAAALCSLALAIVLPVCAQVDRGSITGTVSDESGAAMARVRVSVRNTLTSSTYVTETNDVGLYIVPNLPSGNYEASFGAQGFKTVLRTGIELGISDIRRVHITMELGQVADTIEVRSLVSDLKTDTPEVSVAIDFSALVYMPIMAMYGGRIPEAFAYKVTPAAYGDSWTHYIAGGTECSNETLLDGVTAATNRAGGFGESSPSVEALQELKIQTFGYSAEFGRMQAGLFSYEMKSGNNSWHGSGFGQLNNEVFDANLWTNNAAGKPRQKDRQWDVAASLGGPVYIPKIYDGHNRTFFYFTTEKHRLTNDGMGAPKYANPIADYYDGDFSRILGQTVGTDALGNPIHYGAIYDPTTARQLSNGQWVASQFPGNRIPVSRFSTVAKRLNALLERDYTPSIRDASDGLVRLTQNATYPASDTPSWNQVNYSVKGDQVINDHHKLAMSYSRTGRPRFQASHADDNYLWNEQYSDGGPLAASRTLAVNTDLARLAHDWTITPSLLSHLTVFLNRTTTLMGSRGTSHSGFDGAAQLGISGISTIGYPVFAWSNSGGIYNPNNAGFQGNSYAADQSSGLLETVTKVYGRHVIKGGFDYRRYIANTSSERYVRFNFSAYATSIPNSGYAVNSIGYGFASYLLGIVDSASITEPTNTGGRRSYTAAFIQDDFKLRKNLTLNLGMRWEYNSPHREVANRLDAWDPAVTDPATGMPGAYVKAGTCAEYCIGRDYFGVKDYRDLGPRLGLAWQPEARTTLRASYALMYEGDAFNGVSGSYAGTSTQNAWGGTWYTSANSLYRWNGIFNLDSGVPARLYHATDFNPSWGDSNTPVMIDPRYGLAPYIQNWNVSVQRELPGRIVLDMGYVGSKATRLRDSDLLNLNQISMGNFLRYQGVLGNSITNADDATRYGVRYPYAGFSGTVMQALLPYPNVYNSDRKIYDWGAPVGFSTYNALQVQVTRRLDRGVTLNATYNRQKSLTNVQSSKSIDNNWRAFDTYNTPIEKQLAKNNIPRSLRGWASYELPVGRGRRFLPKLGVLGDALAGNWTLSGVFTYDGGRQLWLNSVKPNFWNGGANRFDVYGTDFWRSHDTSFNAADQQANPLLLNPGQLVKPQAGAFGSGATTFTSLLGFPRYQEDVTLQKTFVVREKYKIRVRFDCFNVFNRHYLEDIDLDPQSKTFGRVIAVADNYHPRSGQVNMRLDF